MKRISLLILISQLSILTGFAQVFVDFETSATTPPLSCEGNTAAVVNNPDPSGINTSAKVGYYSKIAGNWHYVQMSFPNKYQIKTNNTLKFKVYCSQQGRIFAKFWNNGSVLIESWAPEWNFQPVANTWVQCEMDMTPAMNKEFDVLEIAACVDNNEVAEVYFDDFELSNPDIGDGSPKVAFSVSKTKVIAGQSVSFDGGQSFDYDGNIVTYSWDFGDGSTANGITTDHTYTTAGVYSAKLTCTDNEDKSSSKSTLIFVVGADAKLSDLQLITENPSTYSKIEAVFQTGANYANVYNPDEVKIDAEITNPDGSKYLMPCFYFINSIDQKNTWVIDSSYQAWMLRFTSNQVGTHQIKLVLTDLSGSYTSDVYSVDIAQGDAKGFVQRDNANKQYYRYTTGQPFYPMGINEGWDLTSNYTKIIGNLSEGGANIIRYWQTPFNRQALEWTKNSFYDGLGKYSQAAAGMTDYLLNYCTEKDVYIQLVLLQHGPFSENVDPMWDTNPYNSANGGFVDQAEKFFYNSNCDVQIKKLFRYIVARWGYSTHIYAWEFFNEIWLTGNHPNQSQTWYNGIINWHDRMSSYIESIDPYNHLKTTSVDYDMMTDFDKVPNLDIIQYHLYSDTLLSYQKNLDLRFRKVMSKGVINGEYGTNYLEADVTIDLQRASIWNSIMNQTPHFAWIWNHYSDQTWSNLFKLATDFTSAEDFVAQGKLEQVSTTTVLGRSELPTSVFRSPKNYYGYVYENLFKSGIEGAYTILNNVPVAYYDITWYQPANGQYTTEENVPIIRSNNKIALPIFDKDIAFKIKYKAPYTLPIAIAGEDTTVAPGDVLHLSGVKSSTPSGNSLTYVWSIAEKPSASAAIIANATQRDIVFTPDISGTYKISLVVNDGTASSAPDVIRVIVSAKPIAIAGNDTTVYLADKTFTFDGSGSYDTDEDPLTYNWEIISAPEESSQRIYNTTTIAPKLKLDAVGEYAITLVVSDGISFSQPDTIVVTVKEGNYVPSDIMNDVEFFPNPVRDILYLKNEKGFTSGTQIVINDASGRTIFQYEVNSTSALVPIAMDKVCIQNGIYIIKVSNSKSVSVLKVVYQK